MEGRNDTWRHAAARRPATPPLLRKRLAHRAGHDLVLSKGQANYEAYGDLKGVYFLLIVKCQVVAADGPGARRTPGTTVDPAQPPRPGE